MKNLVSFKTSNAAKVKVYWVEGGTDNRQMAIFGSTGDVVTKTEVTAAKNETVVSTLELADAGTYYLGGLENNNYIFKIEVEETAAVEEPVVKEYELDGAKLEAAAAGCTAKITGLPHVSGVHDKIGDLGILIAEQRDLIDLKVRQSVIEYNRLNRYIASVDDAQMRMILSLRYVNGLSWQQVAFSMGETDESYPRRKHNVFLRKSEVAENAEMNVVQ